MDFPEATISFSTAIFGNTTQTIVDGSAGLDVHVFSITMQQERDLSNTEIVCGTDIIAKNYGKDFPQIFTDYHCDSQNFQVVKTGNDEAFVQVLYATSSQHAYFHESESILTDVSVSLDNQLTGPDTLFMGGIIIFFLSFIAWRYFKLKPR